MKNYINTVIIGLTVVICVCIFSFNLISLKTAQNNYIAVTGSATKSFVSDLIVWGGSFSKKANTTKEAYEKLKRDTVAVKEYLTKNGVDEQQIIFSSISIDENYNYEYNEQGRITKTTFTGYSLTQNVTIKSSEVDKIEQISRDITELIDFGVEFFSNRPEYYYTKLDELKLDLIAESSENTRIRAETIAKKSGGHISKLQTANLGVFQITPENSSADGYSSGGTFDVSSKNKTAFITTRLTYLLK
ncbi:MAG: SIMPL domain-containing protein [Termitinemataceae bacterium]|nr:MAG: SIMPL domain-containing protein [Termitinemataceae bacterium]